MWIGDPCSCLVLHLHISGRRFGATTPYGASPHICAFYLQFVTEPQTTVHKIDVNINTSVTLQFIQRRSQFGEQRRGNAAFINDDGLTYPATTTTTTTATAAPLPYVFKDEQFI